MRSDIRVTFMVLFSMIFLVVACSNKETEDNLSDGIKKDSDLAGEKNQTEEELIAIPTKMEEILQYWPAEEWKRTSPESVGMDSALLQDMFDFIEKENIPMEGLLVVKDGYIVAEKYGGEYNQEVLHPIYSVTKSITSALVGVAIEQGKINSVDDKVLNYLDDAKIENKNNWVEGLSIKRLLTMRSGIDFPEQTKRGFYQSDTWNQFMQAEDPAYFIMNRPIRKEPDFWNYSTGDARVVSKVVQVATGQSLSDFARIHLFKPMGITDVEWPVDQSGTSYGGTGIMMKPRDIAKIGYLYLRNGRWEDKQIFPKGWVDESTKPYGDTNQNFDGDKYGYFLWLKSILGFNTFRGMGLYGQYMVIVPDLNLVVVQTSSGMDVDPLLEKYIIPSIR
ncbi:serine hydrolase [Bacillus spongiae]|uniref:Serine hydrolase n=1 Tax=Bacillus spongiae TaxID=2683610 RepID=A0ABU8HBK3_9BACI